MKLTKQINELKFTIRNLLWTDIDLLCKFVNSLSAEDTYVMLSGEKISRELEIQYVSNSLILVDQNKKIHLVVIHNGEIVGNAEVKVQEKRKKHIGVITIAIHKNYRGLGLGTLLLKTLIRESKKIKLKMLCLSSMDVNLAGIAVYEKLGFQKAGYIPSSFLYKGKYVGEVFFFLEL